MTTRKFIPASELFAEWHKNPDYVAAYDALEEEFAIANALIAGEQSGISSRQVPEIMAAVRSSAAEER